MIFGHFLKSLIHIMTFGPSIAAARLPLATPPARHGPAGRRRRHRPRPASPSLRRDLRRIDPDRPDAARGPGGLFFGGGSGALAAGRRRAASLGPADRDGGQPRPCWRESPSQQRARQPPLASGMMTRREMFLLQNMSLLLPILLIVCHETYETHSNELRTPQHSINAQLELGFHFVSTYHILP